MATDSIDPVALARRLIRRPSVTPEDAGALDVLCAPLQGLGFDCHRLRFEAPGTAPVDSLYARLGEAAPNLCFADLGRLICLSADACRRQLCPVLALCRH